MRAHGVTKCVAKRCIRVVMYTINYKYGQDSIIYSPYMFSFIISTVVHDWEGININVTAKCDI